MALLLFHKAWILCVCILGMSGCGGMCGIQWTGLNLVFPSPHSYTTYYPLSYAHFTFHTLLWIILLPTPRPLSSWLCKLHPSFKVLTHEIVPASSAGRNSFLDSPSSSFPWLVSLSSPTSLGLFLFLWWAVNSFRTRLCCVHFCVLCTTLLYLK